MSKTEIRDELKTQGVVEVRRVTVKKDGKVIPTNTLFLTLNRPDVPKEITKINPSCSVKLNSTLTCRLSLSQCQPRRLELFVTFIFHHH